jgi:hypothetical protein
MSFTSRTLVTLPEGTIVTSKTKTPACVRMPPMSDNSGLPSRTLRGGAGRSLAGTHFGAADASRARADCAEPVGAPETPSADPATGCCSADRCDAARHPTVAVTHKTNASAVWFRVTLAKYWVNTLVD